MMVIAVKKVQPSILNMINLPPYNVWSSHRWHGAGFESGGMGWRLPGFPEAPILGIHRLPITKAEVGPSHKWHGAGFEPAYIALAGFEPTSERKLPLSTILISVSHHAARTIIIAHQ